MEGRCKDLIAPPDLHDVAAEQHADTVGEHAHDGKVVRDEQHGDAALGLQALQERQDARLDRDVERRQDLVAEQQRRLGDEAARDGDALALAARQFVRKAVGIFAVEPDVGRALRRRLSGEDRPKKNSSGRASAFEMRARGLSEASGFWNTNWISRRSSGAALPDMARERLAGQRDAARGRRDQPGDGARQRRLPAAGFAHQGERLAFLDVET